MDYKRRLAGAVIRWTDRQRRIPTLEDPRDLLLDATQSIARHRNDYADSPELAAAQRFITEALALLEARK